MHKARKNTVGTSLEHSGSLFSGRLRAPSSRKARFDGHTKLGLALLVAVIASCLAASCAAPDGAPDDSVSGLVQSHNHRTVSPGNSQDGHRVSDTTPPSSHRDAFRKPSQVAQQTPIATVDGDPVARREVVDLLLASHGPGVLEQLIVLRLAAKLARDKGLSVGDRETDDEYERTLRRLSDPLFALTTGPIDRAEAERVLDVVLAERNISRAEFMVGMRINACLRRIIESEITFTDQQLSEQLQRRFGERVLVRHIQSASVREAGRLREQLSSGADFAELARSSSANVLSGGDGGLLEPFSQNDEQVPAVIREVAFSLTPGRFSDPIRVGAWYHVIKLEQRLPRENVNLDDVRDQLAGTLRERLSGPAMSGLYDKLLEEAHVVIHDPVLDESFRATHPAR